MGAHAKLPVLSTASLTLQKSVAVARRHWLLVLIYAVIPVAILLVSMKFFPIKLGRNVDTGPFIVLFGLVQLYLASFVFLALVTHNEVLRGTAAFDAATMGRGGRRVLGYIFDVLLVMFGVLVTLLGIIFFVSKLIGLGSRPPGPEGLVVLGFIALWLAAVLAIGRLMLRLPSRSLGRPLPWREVWRLGKGNSWRLVAGLLLVSAAVGLAAGAATFPLQLAFMPIFPPPGPAETGVISPLPFADPNTPFVVGAVLSLLLGLSYPASTIVFCVFYSLAYVRLRDGSPERNEHLLPDLGPPAQL